MGYAQMKRMDGENRVLDVCHIFRMAFLDEEEATNDKLPENCNVVCLLKWTDHKHKVSFFMPTKNTPKITKNLALVYSPFRG